MSGPKRFGATDHQRQGPFLMQASGQEPPVSERKACAVAQLTRGTYRYAPRPRAQGGLRERLRELAQRHRRFDYRHLTVLLHRKGWACNAKWVYRLYRVEQLQVRRRRGGLPSTLWFSIYKTKLKNRSKRPQLVESPASKREAFAAF